MNSRFPPRPTRHYEIELLLEIFNTVVEGRTAIYVSAALTTGKRFSDWHAVRGMHLDATDPAYAIEYRRLVVEPNRADVQRFVQDLRKKLRRVVIDPTALNDRPGWTQDDYRVLWARVIERYVDTIIFANGWQYSNGCCYELLIGHQAGATTLDERRSSLTLDKATQMIRSAINDMRRHNVPTGFLESVLHDLVTRAVKQTARS